MKRNSITGDSCETVTFKLMSGYCLVSRADGITMTAARAMRDATKRDYEIRCGCGRLLESRSPQNRIDGFPGGVCSEVKDAGSGCAR